MDPAVFIIILFILCMCSMNTFADSSTASSYTFADSTSAASSSYTSTSSVSPSVSPSTVAQSSTAQSTSASIAAPSCQLRGGSNNDSYCKQYISDKCLVNGKAVQPCTDTVYTSCMRPVPYTNDHSKCLGYATKRCEETMQKCRQTRDSCIQHYQQQFPNNPNYQKQCKKCDHLDKCVEELTKECSSRRNCWTPLVEFLQKTAPSNYADVWHTLSANGISTTQQLADAKSPMKFWPYFIGKQDSQEYNKMKLQIANLQVLAKKQRTT